MGDVRRVPATAMALALLFATASPAHADGASWSSIQVKDGGDAADQVTVAGRIADAASLPAGASVTLRFGEYTRTLAAGELVRNAQKITWKAASGSTGLQSFSLVLKSGKFKAKAKGIEAGDLDDDVAFSIDVGGRSIATRHALAGTGAKRKWKVGQPLRAVIAGQMLEVTHALGNVLLRPAASLTLLGGGDTPGVRVESASSITTADGYFTLEVEADDVTALEEIDVGSLLGAPSGFTVPGFSRVTAGDDGEAQGVVFVETRRGSDRTIPAGGTTLDSPGADGAPSGTLTVPAGAVDADLRGVRFTPLGLGVALPAPLPDAYVYVAGAELSADDDVTFAAAAAPTMTLSRPTWADKAPLTDADLRLLWWDGERWVEQSGAGAYDAVADRVGPAASSPARIPATGFSAYASKVGGASAKAGPAPKRRIRGRVKDRDGLPLRSQVVLTRAGAALTGADGTYEIPVSALAGDSIEVVQAIGGLSTASRAVTADEAEDGEVEVTSARAQPPALQPSTISGRIFEAGGEVPSAGATATVRLATAVRGVELDDAGTPDDYFDDRLRVPDLSDLGVRSFRWFIRFPGEAEEFESAETGPSVSMFELVLEANDAGRSFRSGAYTARVAYDVPVIGEISLYAGFRISTVGFGLELTDVEVPAAIESASARVDVADGEGDYAVPVLLPLGIPMTLTCVSADGQRTDVQSFQFARNKVLDAVLPLGPDPDPPAGVGQDVWVSRASMGVAREAFGIAVLDGRIWVAGGLGSGGAPLASLESFDPVSNTWTSRASMSAARDRCALVAARGKLYAIGGFDGTSTLSSVEVYDPATDSWSAGVPLPGPREDAKGVLVGNRIYACSGTTARNVAGKDPEPTVVAFDLDAGVWQSGPSMQSGGVWLGGAVLVNGLIYCRGVNYDYTSIQTLDPSEGVWRVVDGVFSDDRLRECGVALLNGEVMAVGGYETNPLVSSWDPKTGSTTSRTPLPAARQRLGAAVVNGVLYAVGGRESSVVVNTVLAYRPGWLPRKDMPTARHGVAAAAVGARIFVTGGTDRTASLSKLEVYDTARDTWSVRASMSTAREDHGMAQVDGLVYAVGGVVRPAGTALASVEVYDPALDAWSPRAPMSRTRPGLAVASVLGKVYAIGGSDATVEAYDPLTDTWTNRAPMSTRRVRAAVTVVGGRIFVCGGNDGAVTLGSVEVYDPGTNVWTPRAAMIGGPLGLPVYEDVACAAVGTRAVVIGGFNPTTTYAYGDALAEVYSFDSFANAWATGPVLLRGTRGAAAVEIGGKVYLVGGRGTVYDGSPFPPALFRSVLSWRPE